MKRFELNENGLVTKEIAETYEVKIEMKEWNGKRYYVKRDGKQIGWISMDLTEAVGTTSTHTYWLSDILEAVKSGR